MSLNHIQSELNIKLGCRISPRQLCELAFFVEESLRRCVGEDEDGEPLDIFPFGLEQPLLEAGYHTILITDKLLPPEEGVMLLVFENGVEAAPLGTEEASTERLRLPYYKFKWVGDPIPCLGLQEYSLWWMA